MSDFLRVEFKPRFEDMLRRLGGDLEAARRAGMIVLVETVEAGVKKIEAPHAKTGNLVGGISSSVNTDGTRGVVNATAKNERGHDYAPDVFLGTGIYGPIGEPIKPKTAMALNIPGIGFRKSVKGFKGRNDFEVTMATINPQRAFDAGVMNYMKARGW